MKKLDKKTQKLWAERVATLEEREKEVNAAFDEYQTAISGYNEAVREAEEMRQAIENDIQHYMDVRPAKWHDSPKGERYEQWLTEWRDAEMQDLEEPADPFGPHDVMASALTDLPDEVDLTCLED